MKIDKKHVLEIIEATPLVSIDLVIRNPSNKVLLGKRNNHPAMGFWFVPGGWIFKKKLLLNERFLSGEAQTWVTKSFLHF